MKILLKLKPISLSIALGCTLSFSASAAVIINGGFESGFFGWTRADQPGSDGTFALQTGTASPVNGDAVPAPPGGVTAAMTDAQGPGTHALYQDVVIPSAVASAVLSFDLFIGNRAGTFFSPNTLDFSTPALNQQARVDILLAGTDPFSVGSSDVLMNVYQTNPGDPAVSGYTHRTVDITSLLNSNVGNTLRLRFAEADNLFTFQLGVDNVDISPAAAGIPEPATWTLLLGGILLAGARIGMRRR